MWRSLAACPFVLFLLFNCWWWLICLVLVDGFELKKTQHLVLLLIGSANVKASRVPKGRGWEQDAYAFWWFAV